MKTTTKEDFELFKQQCEVWIDWWGLKDWLVDYVHKEIKTENAENPLGTVTASQNDKYAIISFNTECPEQLLNHKEICHTAFHEVAELLMMDFWNLAVQRYDVSYDQLEEKCHMIIARMTNAIFKDYYETLTEE